MKERLQASGKSDAPRADATPDRTLLPPAQMSLVSAISRGSGMSSGNYCLAADNFIGLNEKCRRLEQDKVRLTSQINQMLQVHRELQAKLEEEQKSN